MWLKRHNTFGEFITYFVALYLFSRCEAISNAEFNNQIRGYSVVENSVNLSDVKTLQKQGAGLSQYASDAPLKSPIKFKDADDSVISGSSHARGFVHHGLTGYSFDYEDPKPYPGYEYPGHGGLEPHDYHHYEFHDAGHHHPPAHSYGHGHHKYYDHGLAHKALLWPIAGIALLGAAAALVTNPVLLQLGVVSGKRRRRHVEDIENTAQNSIQKWTQINNNYQEETDNSNKVVQKRMLRKNDYQVGKRVLQNNGDEPQLEVGDKFKVPNRFREDRRFVSIPLLVRNP